VNAGNLKISEMAA